MKLKCGANPASIFEKIRTIASKYNMTGKKLGNENIMSTLASAFNFEYSLIVSVAMGELEKDATKDLNFGEIMKDIHR